MFPVLNFSLSRINFETSHHCYSSPMIFPIAHIILKECSAKLRSLWWQRWPLVALLLSISRTRQHQAPCRYLAGTSLFPFLPASIFLDFFTTARNFWLVCGLWLLCPFLKSYYLFSSVRRWFSSHVPLSWFLSGFEFQSCFLMLLQ